MKIHKWIRVRIISLECRLLVYADLGALLLIKKSSPCKLHLILSNPFLYLPSQNMDVGNGRQPPPPLVPQKTYFVSKNTPSPSSLFSLKLIFKKQIFIPWPPLLLNWSHKTDFLKLVSQISSPPFIRSILIAGSESSKTY